MNKRLGASLSTSAVPARSRLGRLGSPMLKRPHSDAKEQAFSSAALHHREITCRSPSLPSYPLAPLSISCAGNGIDLPSQIHVPPSVMRSILPQQHDSYTCPQYTFTDRRLQRASHPVLHCRLERTAHQLITPSIATRLANPPCTLRQRLILIHRIDHPRISALSANRYRRGA